MFDFISNRFRKRKKKTVISSLEMIKSRKRTMFLESLEDRRLLATDITLTDLDIIPDGTGTPVAIGDGSAVNIDEGDVLLFTGTTVDDSSGGVDLLVELEVSSVSSNGPIASDFEVDVAGSDFDGSSAIPFKGSTTIPAATAGGTVFTFEVIVTQDTVVELNEGFTVQLFKTVDPADGGTPQAHYASAPTLTVENTDTAVVNVSGGGSGLEDSIGTSTVTYTLVGDIDQALTGTISITDGTAVDGGAGLGENDYDPGVIDAFSVQNSGDAGSAGVVVNPDNAGFAVVERDETVDVTLGNLQIDGGSLASSGYAGFITVNTDAEVIIENDDNAIISVSSIAGPEDALNTSTVTYELIGNIDQELTGVISVSDGTAVDGGLGLGDNDYNLGTVEPFAVQEDADSASASIEVNDDNVAELDEVVNVTLDSLTIDSSPLAASLYSDHIVVTAATTFEIQNDDFINLVASDVTGTESDLAAANPIITFALDGDIDVSVTGLVNAFDGTANDGGDPLQGGDDYDVVAINNSDLQTGTSTIELSVRNGSIVERHETIDFVFDNIFIGGVDSAASPYVTSGILTIDDDALLTILNDDAASISIGDDRQTNEGDAGTTAEAYVATATNTIQAGVGYSLSSTITDGIDARELASDVGSDDYDINTTSIFLGSFWNGQDALLAEISVNGDAVVERDETVNIALDALPAPLSSLTLVNGIDPAVTIDRGTAVHTILNDDSAAISVINNTSDVEGGTHSVEIEIDSQVELYGTGDLIVSWNNTDSSQAFTADPSVSGYLGDQDYTAQSATLAFDGTVAGATALAVTTTADDSWVEFDEVFNVAFTENELRGYGAAGSGDITVTTDVTPLTILNNDIATVTHSNGSGTVAEGGQTDFDVVMSTGVQTAIFTSGVVDDTPRLVTNFITGNGVAADLVGVQRLADINDGAADFVGDNDYEDVDEVWSYQGGDSLSVTFDVLHEQDIVVELEEVYRANYTESDYLGFGASGLNRVQLDTNHDLGFIAQEDSAQIDIVLDPAYSTSPNTGALPEGTDAANPLAFGAHGFSIDLDNPVQDYAGTGFIVNNFSTDGSATALAGVGNGFEDYNAYNTTVTFDLDVNNPLVQEQGAAAQSATQEFEVRLDETVELDETFNLNISENDFGPFGSTGSGQLTVGNSTAQITLLNDDSATLQVLDTSVNENDGTVTVDVILDYPVDVSFGVDFNATDGLALHSTATSAAADANQEWQWPGGVWTDSSTLTFDANTDAGEEDGPDPGFQDQADPGNGSYAETQSVTFEILDDSVVERDEDFYVNIFNLTDVFGRDVSIADDDGKVTIVNDDAATVSVTSVIVNEGDATATVSVALSAPVDAEVSVSTETVDVTASQGTDYTANIESKVFPALAAASQDFVVTLGPNDNLVELNEVIDVVLKDLQADGREVAMGTANGSITITDNDTAELSVALTGGATTVNESDGTITFDVALSNPVAVPVTVNFGAQNPQQPGSYDDFAGGVGSITFAPGDNATQFFSVDINDDAVVELDEDLEVVLFGLDAGVIQDADNSDVTIAGPSDTFTVIDNDTAGISINDVSFTENDHGHGLATFTVTLDTAVDSVVDVQFDTADGTAEEADTGNNGGDDYEAITGGNIRFAGTAGETQTISVQVNGDNVVELTESLSVVLSNVSANGRGSDIFLTDNTGELTIENDDSATVGIELSDAVAEAGGTVDLTVTLSAPVDVQVNVEANDIEGTAKVSGVDASESDYQDVSEVLSFNNPTGSALELVVTVEVNDDGIVELDEAFQVALSALSNGGRDVTMANAVADVQIINDDSATVTINDVVVAEESGTATLTLSLSAPVDTAVTVPWSTLDGTALAVFNDYSSDSDVVSYSALDTSDKQVTIDISDDDIVELDEVFHVALQQVAASGRDVTVADAVVATGDNTNVVGSGSITVINTDTATIEIHANSDAYPEGDDAINEAMLTVTLSNPVDIPVFVDYASSNGAHNSSNNDGLPSASGPEYAGVNSTADNDPASEPIGNYDFINAAYADDHDYDDTEGVLNFAAVNNGLTNGAAEQTLFVPIYGDEIVELDEWLRVAIGTSDFLGRSVTVTKGEDFVWIDNDDDASFSINDVTVTEGDAGQAYAVLNVTLDQAVDVPVSLTYTTVDDTATSATTLFHGDEDYVHTTGVLNFAGAEDEVQEIQVVINGDRVVELDELFEVQLSDVQAQHRDVTIADSDGVVTVLNDDSATVKLTDVALEEGDAGATVATSLAILSAPVDVAVNVPFGTVDGTAEAGSDYTAVNGTVSFGNLKTDSRVFDIDVDILGDTDFERHEDLYVELGILDASGRTVTFLDTDDRPAVESRIDIANDDRNERNFIGACNIIAEPGDVDLNDGLRYAAWSFSMDDDIESMDVQFTAATAAGESLEIGVPQLLDNAGNPVAPLKVNHVTSLDATKSYGVFRISGGDYTVVVPSGNDSDGLIELVVSQPGIMSVTDTEVTSAAFQQTAAGVLQTQLGYRGTMPEVFNDLMGLDLAVDQYDACLDADHNGFMTVFDLSAVDNNLGDAVPGVNLVEDRFTPAQILEVNPLGAAELSISDIFGFSIYQNPQNNLDVNDDGHISPIDALVTINSLNDEGSRSVLVLGDSEGDMGEFQDRGKYLYDTNGDYAITPIDVLQVVNALNSEGESAVPVILEMAEAEGENSVDELFAEYVGVKVNTATPDATVTAIEEISSENEYPQEYYTTPAQQSNWSNAVDDVFDGYEAADDSDELELGSLDN